jgi:hypothetical protein
MAKENTQNKTNGSNLDFEAQLWAAADKMRGHMDASEYKHVCLGLIFLKYISDAFEEKREQLLFGFSDPKSEWFIKDEPQRADAAENRDEYLAANVFWLPPEARWHTIKAKAKSPEIGKVIDDAMGAIERENPTLKGVLPRDYARPSLDKVRLGGLVDIISNIGFNESAAKSKDVLGRVYEYEKFASAEGTLRSAKMICSNRRVNRDFSLWIGVRTQRDALLTSLATLRQIPPAPLIIDADVNAERIVKKVLSQFREADETFDAPTNWKPVKEKLTKTLDSIVNEHLPHTLEKLWRELALNLTAAPWLLPDPFRIDVVTRRGEQASTIRIKDRLARYILNQAEIHTLGLAWFFTRHLTRGRFFQACIVMDDPAHELDQTSFRDLCRLWETLMRLHRVYNRPLKLIVMLNQESRAVEAARATGAILSVLGWEREQDQSVRAISVIGEGFHAPQPASMFALTGT